LGLGGILPVLRSRILTAAKTIEELGNLPVQGGMVLESLRVNGLQSGNRGVGFVGMDLERDQRGSQKVRRKVEIHSPREVGGRIGISARIHQDDSIIEIRFPESRIELDGDFQMACKGVLHKARVHTQELFCGKR